MKRIHLYTAAVLLSLASSCSDEDLINGVVIDSSIDIVVRDTKGNDLLDPAHPEAININDIKVYYVIDGKETFYYNANLDASGGFSHIEPELDLKLYRIRLFLNDLHEYKPGIYRTIIEWKPGDRDIIDAEYVRSGASVWLTKARLNDIPMEDRCVRGNDYQILTK